MNGQKSEEKHNCSNSIIIKTSNDSESIIETMQDLNKTKKVFKTKVPELDSYSGSESTFNQGRWSPVEHLIFLACIIQFGRDWKKIEFYVQTRSSSQARSHAQKVLKKFDRPSLIREVFRQKQRIKFDPKEYKCESLSVFNQPDEEPAIRALCGKKRKSKAKQVEAQANTQITGNKINISNSNLQNLSLNVNEKSDENDKVVQKPSSPLKDVLNQTPVADSKFLNSSVDKQTPQTCASEKSTPLLMSHNIQFNINENKTNLISPQKLQNSINSCVRKLDFDSKPEVSISTPNKPKNEVCEKINDQISFASTSTNFLSAMLNTKNQICESMLDFGFENDNFPIYKIDDKSKTTKSFNQSVFDSLSLYGDELFPLSMMY